MNPDSTTPDTLPRIIIVGGGFGGLAAARALKTARAKVGLIDKTNHHVFQPLLYQVATGVLSPEHIAAPLRQVLGQHANTTVLKETVIGVDMEKKHCVVEGVMEGAPVPLPYDYLVLATGVQTSYFGNDEYVPFAPGLKTIADADHLRNKILGAFENCERTLNPKAHPELLTFVIVGAGPTGVELAGAIAELARLTLASEFRRFDPASLRILLVGSAPRVLPPFHESLGAAVKARLEKMGVEVWTGTRVEKVDAEGVMIKGERIPTRNIFWTAGVKASPASKWLGVEADKAGRVKVLPDCSVPGHPEVFVVGDTAAFEVNGKPLPGVAQVAIQQGRYVGRLIAGRLCGDPVPPPFKYFDKGSMATIGRSFAVMETGRMRNAGVAVVFRVWGVGLNDEPGERRQHQAGPRVPQGKLALPVIAPLRTEPVSRQGRSAFLRARELPWNLRRIHTARGGYAAWMFTALLDRIIARFPRTGKPLLWLRKHRKTRRTLIVAFCHLLGALTSIHAILGVRTSQGAIAWAVSLNTFPYVAVPAYWVFGRSNFEGYVVLRRKAEAELSDAERQLARDLLAMRPAPEAEPASAALLEKLAKLPATRGNHTELLIDGEATFRAIFEGIEQARDYVLVQFYIIHDDGLGRRLKDALIAKARAGVRCYVLYDEIGSHHLPDAYVNELRAAGVDIRRFNTRKGDANRFQLNFRNHRKIVVVDGRTAFVGGHNVGDEYLGKDAKIGAWRDTHVKVQGPVVQCVQISWIEDWNWAAGSRPTLNWTPAPAPGGDDDLAFCLPSGPADTFETCTLFFLHAIHAAKKRVWIASPYFVPDEQFISALQLAALRGVDVRILVPAHADSQLVWLSGFTFLPELEKAGVQTWRYHEGFLHEKAILVDDYGGVGTANFDNRSFRLNFEIALLFAEPSALRAAEAMFAADFARSTRATAADFTARPWWFRLAARTSRLMAPVQ